MEGVIMGPNFEKLVFVFGGAMIGVCCCPIIIFLIWPKEILPILPQVAFWVGIFCTGLALFMWAFRDYWEI